jgi:hypothetical protein
MFFGLCCRDNGISPIEDATPGRRDYTWFIDTIYAGGNIIRGIDGVSPSDVWAISSPGDFSQTFYHFDGVKWSTDGANRSIAPEAIHAFASNDVWSVGLGNDIWHYDGNAWNFHTILTADSSNFYSLEDIGGYSSTNMYAVGLHSYQGSDIDLHPLVYHFDGNNWLRINIQDVVCTLYKIRFFSLNKALVLGLKNQNSNTSTDTNKIFIFNGNNLQEIYSGVNGAGAFADIAQIPGGILMLKGRDLFFFDGANQQDIITVQNSKFGYSVEGRSTKDVFLGMMDGIAHYNGTDIQYLYNFSDPNSRMDFIKVFPNSIFINTFNNSKQINIIFRGYLK